MMKAMYEAPRALLALYTTDVLLASGEGDGNTPGGDNFWVEGEDGTIHLPAVPLN